MNHIYVFLDLTFCNIKVEEVTIQDGLDNPSHNSDHVKESLKVEPPNPVEEIEGTVDSQAEQVVGGDGLGLSSLTDQEELRQDGHGLKVDGEGPQDLSRKMSNFSLVTNGQYTKLQNLTILHVPNDFYIKRTSNGEKSWLTKKDRPPTGTTRNSTLKVSWFPS